MNIKEIKKGMIARNQYGERVIILEVIDNLMIRVLGDNNLYHWTKLTINGKSIS